MIVATDPGIIYPEVYDMQVEAIMIAACEVVRKKVVVEPEIMIPLVGRVRELESFFHKGFNCKTCSGSVCFKCCKVNKNILKLVQRT